jgi:hypothetical protein
MDRRTFLRTAPVVGLAIATPAIAAEPERTPRERAIWHLREVERLVREDGGQKVVVQAIGTYTSNEDCRFIGIHHSGRLTCDDNMFAEVGKV